MIKEFIATFVYVPSGLQGSSNLFNFFFCLCFTRSYYNGGAVKNWSENNNNSSCIKLLTRFRGLILPMVS